MTKRMQLVMGDDLVDYDSKGREHVDADETLCLALGPDPQHLTVRELDLTKAHADELRLLAGRYLNAGHEPGEAPLMPGTPPAPRTGTKGQYLLREEPGTRVFYKALRDYADSHQMSYGGEHQKHNYRYPVALVSAFLAYLMEQSAAGDGTAAGLLAIARTLRLPVPVPAMPGAESAQVAEALPEYHAVPSVS